MKKRSLVLSLLLVLAAGWLAVAARPRPAAVKEAKDRVILQGFLKRVELVPSTLSRERCRKLAETDSDNSEALMWQGMPYAQMPLTAYRITGDPKYLDIFVQGFDNMRSALTKGPDGFLGWYGTVEPGSRDPRDPARRIDNMLSSFIATEMVGDFVWLIDQDPALRAKYAKPRRAYLDLVENHLVKKHTVRGDYTDLGAKGAVYRSPAVGMNESQARLTQPHNKNAAALRGLLSLYRATGKDQYMRMAIKLGIRFKHSLTLKNGHYEWNYWDPSGAWDVRRDNPKQWRHWIGPEHRGGYYSLSVGQAVALYEYGLVFDKTDLKRFVKTQETMCWNGSITDPVWSRVDGTRDEQYTQGPYISEALAPFSPLVYRYLFVGPGQDWHVSEANSDWIGGPQTRGWLQMKLVEYPRAKGGTQLYLKYGKQFLAKRANREWLKQLSFEVKAPGYRAPQTPQDMRPRPRGKG